MAYHGPGEALLGAAVAPPRQPRLVLAAKAFQEHQRLARRLFFNFNLFCPKEQKKSATFRSSKLS